MNSKQAFALAFLLIALRLNAHCQQLTVELKPGKQIILTKADIDSLPRVTAAGASNDSYAGATLEDVLGKGGVRFGESLRGKRLASCLLVEGADGYRVIFALPEIDTAFTDKQIVLAFLHNGKPLDDKEGPYRLVVPGEKRMARWVRQVKALKIVDVQ